MDPYICQKVIRFVQFTFNPVILDEKSGPARKNSHLAEFWYTPL